MPLFMEMITETDFAYLLVQIVETPLKFSDITKLCIDEPSQRKLLLIIRLFLENL